MVNVKRHLLDNFVSVPCFIHPILVFLSFQPQLCNHHLKDDVFSTATINDHIAYLLVLYLGTTLDPSNLV
jgi:hypothetical protein